MVQKESFSLQAEAVAQNVRAARKSMKLTQQELAHLSGISRRTITGIEAGENVSIRILDQLAQAMQLPLLDLIGDPGPQPATVWQGQVGSHAQLHLSTRHQGTVDLWTVQLQPGDVYPICPDPQNLRHILQVNAGNLTLESADQTFTYSAGTVQLIHFATPHTIRNLASEPLLFTFVMLMEL